MRTDLGAGEREQAHSGRLSPGIQPSLKLLVFLGTFPGKAPRFPEELLYFLLELEIILFLHQK